VLGRRLATTRELLERYQDARHRHLYVTVLTELSRYRQAAGHDEAAADCYQELDRIFTLALAATPRADLLEGRAAARVNHGNCCLRLGRSTRASELFKLAVDDYHDAWRQLYGDAYYSESLAIALTNLAQSEQASGAIGLATDHGREAIEWLREAIHEQGATIGRIDRMTHCYLMLAEILDRQDDPEVPEHLEQARVLIEYLNQEQPRSSLLTSLERRLAALQASQAIEASRQSPPID